MTTRCQALMQMCEGLVQLNTGSSYPHSPRCSPPGAERVAWPKAGTQALACAAAVAGKVVWGGWTATSNTALATRHFAADLAPESGVH
jgi:hypothetical protein